MSLPIEGKGTFFVNYLQIDLMLLYLNLRCLSKIEPSFFFNNIELTKGPELHGLSE